METKILYIPKKDYIMFYLGFDDYGEMRDFALEVLEALFDNGEYKINVQENFNERDCIAYFLICEMDSDITDEFKEELEENIGSDLPMEFEYKDVKYKIQLG
jgi:hypothetical protein